MKQYITSVLCFLTLISFVHAAENSPSPQLAFRVQNELSILKTGSKIKTTTLFHAGLVYDIIGDKEITVFNPAADTFTLLEPTLRIQTVISSAKKMRDEVHRNQMKMKAHSNPFLAFAASPKFEIAYEDETGLAKFQSKWIEYLVETKPQKDVKLQTAYYDFCDWSCHLSLWVNPDSATMFARMEVNRFLREKGRFPDKIQLSVYPKGNSGISGLVQKPDKYESTHVLAVRLVPADEQLIARIKEQMNTFRVVPIREYLLELDKPNQNNAR